MTADTTPPGNQAMAGTGDGGSPATHEGDPDADVTIVPGVARYHRSRCMLIRFLSDGDLETMTRAEAQAAGCVPCRACQPDQDPATG